MTGHTKGPWYADGLEIRGDGPWSISQGLHTPDGAAYRNARLMASSPDMLHALRLVRVSTEWACMESSTQDAVDAAINKAEL